jgi:hypothetical protein
VLYLFVEQYMRRYSLLLAIGFVSCVLLIATQHAGAIQSADPLPQHGERYTGTDGIERIPLSPWPGDDGQTINGLHVPVEVQPLAIDPTSDLPLADNLCPGADIELDIGQIASGQTDVTLFSRSADDPDLSQCMWGNVQTPQQGYRSAWYEVTAPISGNMTVKAVPNARFSNDYDTVIAIYSAGECDALQANLLTCNDDANGFLSHASLDVTGGETYIIEIIDRKLGASNPTLLSMEVTIDTKTKWQGNAAWNTNAAVRSRHATAVVDDLVYVAGGQAAVDNYVFEGTRPFLRTARLDRFNLATGAWDLLIPIAEYCAPTSTDGGGGYSNTGMAHINGKLYIPSGFVGNNELYTGQHCAYDIVQQVWVPRADAPWPGGNPAEDGLGYATVVTDPYANRYWLVGGITGPFFKSTPLTTVSAELYAYSPDFWFSSPAGQLGAPSVGRYAATGAMVKGTGAAIAELCVIGGLEPTADPLFPASLLPGGECYNPSSRTWRPITPLNIPRYLATSAIGHDGSWYVYGGVNADFKAVAEIEVYDVQTNSWTILPYPYNIPDPARVWPQGGIVNSTLVMIGGETGPLEPEGSGGSLVTAEVLTVDMPLYRANTAPHQMMMPIIATSSARNGEPNDTFETATWLPINSIIDPEFYDQADRFDVYRFDLNSAGTIHLHLKAIPEGDNFDVYLYDPQRNLLASSRNPNNADELILRDLAAGTYYIMVVAEENTNPSTPSPYWLGVEVQ